MKIKIKKKPESELKAEHIALSWWLIERKIMYYYPNRVNPRYHDKLSAPDSEYDKNERRYLKLCRELGLENTICHTGHQGYDDVPGEGMFEVDFNRPSVQLIMQKYGVK